MKIRPVGAKLFRADGRTDRHYEAYSNFSQFLWTRLKLDALPITSCKWHCRTFVLSHPIPQIISSHDPMPVHSTSYIHSREHPFSYYLSLSISLFEVNGFPHHNSVPICCLISVATSTSHRHFLNSILPRDIVSNPVAARSKALVCGLTCWDFGFESRRGHGCLSLACVAYCKVEISATGHCRVQRSPSACGVSECGRGTSQRRARPTTAFEHWLKKTRPFNSPSTSAGVTVHGVTSACW